MSQFSTLTWKQLTFGSLKLSPKSTCTCDGICACHRGFILMCRDVVTPSPESYDVTRRAPAYWKCNYRLRRSWQLLWLDCGSLLCISGYLFAAVFEFITENNNHHHHLSIKTHKPWISERKRMDGDVREIVSAISMDVMKYTKKWKGPGEGWRGTKN